MWLKMKLPAAERHRPPASSGPIPIDREGRPLGTFPVSSVPVRINEAPGSVRTHSCPSLITQASAHIIRRIFSPLQSFTNTKHQQLPKQSSRFASAGRAD